MRRLHDDIHPGNPGVLDREQESRQDPAAHRPHRAGLPVASIGDATAFANGRQLAAWIGLVPRQHSSGGKPKLLGISKRGDTYLRTLLVHGARDVILRAKQKPGYPESWLGRLPPRRHQNIVACALANHNARVAWASPSLDCNGAEVSGSTVPVHVFIGVRQTRWLSGLKRNYPLLLGFSIELVEAAAGVAGLVVPRLVQQLSTVRTQREEL